MPHITAITAQIKDKNRCNIFLDGEYSFSLSIDTVLKYGLSNNLELDTAKVNEIKEEDEKRQAFIKGVNYLSKFTKTKKQCIKYLKDKGFCDKAVYYAVDKLKEYNYIDDLEYARRYMESHSKTQGKKLLDYNLMGKGICKKDIEKASESVNFSSLESACGLAEKRLKNKEKTQENLAKTYRYLLGKGFSYEDAKKAIDKYKGDED